MNQHKFAFSLAWIAALLVAAPAMGQLLNHPVMALPLGDAAGSTFVGAQFARGLNDNSFKDNSFGVGVGRATDKVSYMGMAGYVLDYGVLGSNTELTLGANVAVHLLGDPDAVPGEPSGWLRLGVPQWRYQRRNVAELSDRRSDPGHPKGLEHSDKSLGDCPRVNISRLSIGGVSGTNTDIGASAGLGLTSEGGAGVDLALDYLNVEGGSPFGFSIGAHYMVGS